ncbi:hypothetical protein [Geminocystis sp. NIES-3709]|uniref:hypothetical protein n=1 Tax=Geminocystis sp. NIES-3709 TaxID=1617448 RepID=UPI0008250D15|nr:hypothetical protein [Geminocystis sp. NIES-3709]
MLDDLNNLPIVNSVPDPIYRDMNYILLPNNTVLDEDNNYKSIVAIQNTIDSLYLLKSYKIVHWSKIEGIMRSTPRFYAIGNYTEMEVNDLIILSDCWSMDFNNWAMVEIGDLLWFRDGVFMYVDEIMKLLGVVYNVCNTKLEKTMTHIIMGV